MPNSSNSFDITEGFSRLPIMCIIRTFTISWTISGHGPDATAIKEERHVSLMRAIHALRKIFKQTYKFNLNA